MKIKELQESLLDGVAALIMSPENRLYFTEFEASDGVLIVTGKDAVLFTDSRYFEAACDAAKDCRVVLQRGGAEFWEQLGDLLKELGVKTVTVEATRMTLEQGARYSAQLKGLNFVYDGELDGLINELRSVKTQVEKEKIKRAQEIAEKAYLRVLEQIKPGVCERDLAAEFDYLVRRLGGDGVSFETIALSGASSSKPHGVPGENKVKNGDFVTFDFGAVFCGYHSDTTRTVAVGAVTDEQRRVYDTVLSAQLAGVDALRAGLGASAADAACRDIITAAGYGDNFGHSTGHGVGVEIHEMPVLGPHVKEDIVLQTGNVVTIEPGIYLPGKFGVRIEDMLFVTDDGAENLVTLPKELIIL